MQTEMTKIEQEIRERLKSVPDPEVEVNIVDLGLIYEVHHNEADKTIHIIMTLSARGCPVGDTILQHVKTVAQAGWKDHEVSVELTWEPQWTPEMVTEEGRQLLNM